MQNGSIQKTSSASTTRSEIKWFNLIALILTHALAGFGAWFTKAQRPTILFSVFYYYITILGVTAGYHRLWSHRSFNASKPLQYFLALTSAGALQGSASWWARTHRMHHRYTDSDYDPYNAHEGFWYCHVGWIIFRNKRPRGAVDVTDLSESEVVVWQHRHYYKLAVLMTFIVPTVVPWLLWDDAQGGFAYAAMCRLVLVHHGIFCINSLAHWLGDAPFDDKHTPRDHMITAIVSAGDGYHNFHHQFPMDYRNAIKWYQYDPTKWFIWACAQVGLATHLKTFSENEIRKGQLTMELKRLKTVQSNLIWPSKDGDLPVVTWQAFQDSAKEHPLIVVAGYIHDMTDFLDEHPGGKGILVSRVGKDATAAFFGGVYDHSNAAHNLLAMKRVGILHQGVAHFTEDQAIPPSQRLAVMQQTLKDLEKA